MKKLLVCIQYYPGDRDAAMRIARFIADLEVKRRDDVEFCFAARFDASHDEDTIRYVMNKFKCHKFHSTRNEKNWPAGCNALWHDLMTWTTCQVRDSFAQWEAVLTTESDSVPLDRDWINKLMMEWDNAVKQGKFIVGCAIDKGLRDEHINGNALWDARLMQKIPTMYGTPHDKSWDVFHAKKYMKHSYDTPFMKSSHNIEKLCPVTEQILYSPRLLGITPVFFHGAKSDKAEKIVRQKLGL
jgi:hypothetical protein